MIDTGITVHDHRMLDASECWSLIGRVRSGRLVRGSVSNVMTMPMVIAARWRFLRAVGRDRRLIIMAAVSRAVRRRAMGRGLTPR